MSPNRKADLQRKLAMAPIPKPPAGLAERIKSDIPQHLLVDARKERERFSRSISFNLRVAASIILLVGSVYLALNFLTRAERADMEPKELPPIAATRTAAAAPPPAAPARVAENAPQPVEIPKPTPAPAPPHDDRKRVIVAEAKPEPLAKKEEWQVDRINVGGGSVGGNAAPAEPVPAPAPPPPPPVVAQAESTDAAAAPRAAAKIQSGIVVPRNGGEVRGPALIQQFAAPAAPPRDLRVDVVAAKLGETPLLRVSVDVPEVPHPEGGSQPPVAADATLDIDFNDDAVVSHRAIAGEITSRAPALPSGSSVTALFEIELKPNVSRRAIIATVKLRYRSVTDGREHTLPLKVRRSDLREWDRATKRMKSASLAAALVESLESKESIAEKARAAGLDELAATAERN